MNIEKNVPAPSRQKYDYSFLNVMEINDSVLIPNQSTSTSFYTNLQKKANRIGKKVLARTVDGGLRVWRIE